ncbi:MAG TPA: alpha-amylase family glycosyl hydrolase [Cyclobacteriaceae bacterium]|nr:alpha-amylase family glycosyl hydrolase [Cyclobacteriaceae bacterium]
MTHYEGHSWWRHEVIYQVYPRSFQDTNGDGVGDLKGIIQRLDYLAALGIGTIWITPIYPSPMADFGYDIADYQNVDPLFGNMSDFDELLKETHQRGMRLLLDLVPNHTSDKHPWFIESRSSRDNPKRNWYLWRDPGRDGGLPNNWRAAFGGPAWEWDPDTGQYYYHAFLKEQPDLNWRNPEVQNAMFDMMRFWLKKGVDGFRVDVLWHIIKDEQLRDNPVNPDYQSYMATCDELIPLYSTDQYEVHEIVKKMRAVLDDFGDRIMIGEIYLPISKLVTYYGADNKGVHLPFNFQLITLPWSAQRISAAIQEYEAALPPGGWPNWVLGNHDQPRIASRVGLHQARVAAVMLLTLRGTPTIYYGDEIGMRDVPIPAEEVHDPQGLNMPGKNLSRDPARTPMQWSGESEYAGFSDRKPWLRLDRRYKSINVKAEENDEHSMLALYRKLINLRNTEPSLRLGEYHPVYADHQLISYLRRGEGSDTFLVILNLTSRVTYFRHNSLKFSGVIEISTSPEIEGEKVEDTCVLSGDEAVVIRLINFNGL